LGKASNAANGSHVIAVTEDSTRMRRAYRALRGDRLSRGGADDRLHDLTQLLPDLLVEEPAVLVELRVRRRHGQLTVEHARARAREHLAELGLRPHGAVAPITATGLLRIGAVALGRDAQSIAFFRTPGIDELYSGVANRTASAPAIASRSSATPAGASPFSSSSSNGGTAFSPFQSSTSMPSGASSAVARSSFVLNEASRRLPEIARTFIATTSRTAGR
jgi:hypothetical protein